MSIRSWDKNVPRNTWPIPYKTCVIKCPEKRVIKVQSLTVNEVSLKVYIYIYADQEPKAITSVLSPHNSTQHVSAI